MNPYYNHTGAPQQSGPGSSAAIRSEYAAIMAGFDKLPILSGNHLRMIRVNGSGTALEAFDLNLNLGTMAGQNANNVAITGGSISGVSLTLASPSSFRTHIGIVIGETVQAYSSLLTKFAALSGPADRLVYYSANDTPALATITTYGRSLVAMADAGALLTNLSLNTVAKKDVAQTFTKPQTADVVALASSTAWDAADKQHLTAEVNGSIFTVANPTNLRPLTYYALYVVYTTSHGLAFGNMFRGVNQATPSTVAGAHDHFVFRANAAGNQLELVSQAYDIGAA